MKIRVIDRIILFFLALITLVAGVCAALNEFGISVLALIPGDLIPALSENILFAVRVGVIAAVILLSFYLFSVSFRRKRKPDPFINMDSGSKGSIRMSMDSISSLVQRTCKGIPGIQNLTVTTINHEDSVSVEMGFQVEMSRNIPELSAEVQQMVGEVVERNCGVAVRNVCVTVNGFTEPVQQLDKPAKKGLFAREKKAELPVAPEAPASPVVEEMPAETLFTEQPAPAAVEPAAEPVAEPAAEPVAEEMPVEEIVEVSEPAPAEPEAPKAAPVEEIVTEAVEKDEDDEDDEYLFTENE